MNEMIITEDTEGDSFYIIEEGKIEIFKKEAGGKEKFIRYLESGSHFGEVALINNINRTVSCRSTANSKLLVMHRDTFTRILGSIEKYLKKDY